MDDDKLVEAVSDAIRRRVNCEIFEIGEPQLRDIVEDAIAAHLKHLADSGMVIVQKFPVDNETDITVIIRDEIFRIRVDPGYSPERIGGMIRSGMASASGKAEKTPTTALKGEDT